MASKKDILIVGAGPSGLVAAINLKREGYNVMVREKQERIGGEPGWHPSVHYTPVAMPGLWDYIGIDCTEAFVESADYFKMYSNGKEINKIPIDAGGFCNVERGVRETSLDSLLFRIAEKEGVNFEFGNPFEKEDFSKAPDGTIIASGLSPGMYDCLGIDYSVMAGYWSYSEVEKNLVSAGLYLGAYSNEYGYAASANGIWYVLLFARKEVSEENLEAFKQELETIEGRTFDKWRRFKGNAPKMPRLFYKNFILTGTAAGFVEPAFGGGITGALLSGKISAIAAIDSKRGEAEFRRFTDGIKTHIARKRKPGYMPTLKMGDIWFDIE